MSLFRKPRYERRTFNLTFKTTRVASGGGDSTRYEPVEQLEQWLNGFAKGWRVVSAQQLAFHRLTGFDSAVEYFVVLEREI